MRQYILREIDWDIAESVLYPSKNFTDAGRIEYPALLRSAATDYNEAWLAERLIGSFNEMELSGGKPRKVRRDAHTLFAQSEFNRFYCRGICSYALGNPSNGVRVYRARESSNPRRESELKLGRMVDGATILTDLRAHVGTDVEFAEIYSGLSLELVPNANAI